VHMLRRRESEVLRASSRDRMDAAAGVLKSPV
jgi:hypothetical protein